MAEQAFVLWFADDGNTNLGALNALLGNQQVTFLSPMSSTGEQGGETPQSPFPYSRAAIVLGPKTSKVTQQAFVLWFADDGNTNLSALNTLLGGGWSVAQLAAMSGTGEHGNDTPQSPFPYSRAAVILQR